MNVQRETAEGEHVQRSAGRLQTGQAAGNEAHVDATGDAHRTDQAVVALADCHLFFDSVEEGVPAKCLHRRRVPLAGEDLPGVAVDGEDQCEVADAGEEVDDYFLRAVQFGEAQLLLDVPCKKVSF